MFVAGWAPTEPRRQLGGYRPVVEPATHVAEVGGGRLPGWAVPGSVADDRVGDFVQQDLMRGIVVEPGDDMT